MANTRKVGEVTVESTVSSIESSAVSIHEARFNIGRAVARAQSKGITLKAVSAGLDALPESRRQRVIDAIGGLSVSVLSELKTAYEATAKVGGELATAIKSARLSKHDAKEFAVLVRDGKVRYGTALRMLESDDAKARVKEAIGSNGTRNNGLKRLKVSKETYKLVVSEAKKRSVTVDELLSELLS